MAGIAGEWLVRRERATLEQLAVASCAR